MLKFDPVDYEKLTDCFEKIKESKTSVSRKKLDEKNAKKFFFKISSILNILSNKTLNVYI